MPTKDLEIYGSRYLSETVVSENYLFCSDLSLASYEQIGFKTFEDERYEERIPC
jgi:hypothetical protein